uniref:Uncharacterized protein n=1 Tax=Oryza meridionalis TaxID=40149 RepID=A0A0E0F0T0_9ORYZ
MERVTGYRVEVSAAEREREAKVGRTFWRWMMIGGRRRATSGDWRVEPTVIRVVPTPSLPQRSRHVSVTSSALLRDIHGLARRAAVLYATTVMWGAMAWVERRYDFFRLEVDEQHSEFQIVQVASNHQDGDYFFSCLELKIFSTPHWTITPRIFRQPPAAAQLRKGRGETKKKSVLATAPNASCILTPFAQEGEFYLWEIVLDIE